MLSASLPLRFASSESQIPRRWAAATQTTRIDAVRLGKLRPASLDVPIVLRRGGEPRPVVDAVVIEEHAEDLMALPDRGLRELERGVRRLVLIRAFVDEQSNLHRAPRGRIVPDQNRMCVEALRLLREPRQLSMWNFVNGSSVSSKKRGQPTRSIQSLIRSQSRASSL